MRDTILTSCRGIDQALLYHSPDVAAQGVYYHTILGGVESPASGTSASTPTFAGIVALLNDHLIRNHRKPLGWLSVPITLCSPCKQTDHSYTCVFSATHGCTLLADGVLTILLWATTPDAVCVISFVAAFFVLTMSRCGTRHSRI